MKTDTGNFIDDLLRWQKFFNDSLKTRNKSKHTLRAFTKKVDDFIEFCRTQDEIYRIQDMNRIFINLFMLEMKEKVLRGKKMRKIISNWTINSYITALRSFFSFISENNDDLIDLVPLFNKIKPLKTENEVPRFSPEENRRILLGLQRERKNDKVFKVRNILAIYILYYCGLRASEVLGIRVKDITESSNPEFFGIKVLGKGNKERRVYIKKSYIEDLLKKVTAGLNEDDKVFNICYTTFYATTSAFLRRCNVSKTGLHIFRHNLATLLVQKNTNMQIIQDILGHSNIATTARFYSRTNEASRLEALDKL